MIQVMREVFKPADAGRVIQGSTCVSEMLSRAGYVFIRHQDGVTIYQHQYPEYHTEFLFEFHDMPDRWHINLFTNLPDDSRDDELLKDELYTLELIVGSLRVGKPVINPLLAYNKAKGIFGNEVFFVEIPTDKTMEQVKDALNGVRLVPADMGSSLQVVSNNGAPYLRGKIYADPKALLRLQKVAVSKTKSMMHPSLNWMCRTKEFDSLMTAGRLLPNKLMYPCFSVDFSPKRSSVVIKGWLSSSLTDNIVVQKLILMPSVVKVTLGSYMNLIEAAVQYQGDSTKLKTAVPFIPGSYILGGKEDASDVQRVLPSKQSRIVSEDSETVLAEFTAQVSTDTDKTEVPEEVSTLSEVAASMEESEVEPDVEVEEAPVADEDCTFTDDDFKLPSLSTEGGD